MSRWHRHIDAFKDTNDRKDPHEAMVNWRFSRPKQSSNSEKMIKSSSDDCADPRIEMAGKLKEPGT